MRDIRLFRERFIASPLNDHPPTRARRAV